MKRSRGFTFIEILITLGIIAISFLPLMRMFSVALEQTDFTDDLTTARYLAQEGMEKIENLNLTKTQLKNLGDVWEPPLNKPPLDINGKKWRVCRKLVQGSDPLEIHIQVFKDKKGAGLRFKTKPFVELVTLQEDLEWDFTE